MKKVMLVLILLLGSLAAFSQENPAASGWVRIESKSKEFSFLIPKNFFAYREKDKSHFSSFENKVSINISLNSSKNMKIDLEELDNKYDEFDCKHEDFKSEVFKGKIFTCEGGKQFYKTIYLFSKKRYHKITVGAPSAKNEDVAKFLGSITLLGTPMFPGAPSTGDEIVMPEETVKNDPLVERYLKSPDNDDIPITPANSTKPLLFNADSQIYSRELIILRNYPPAYPKEMREAGPSGRMRDKVKLKVYFLANGQIKKVEVISGGYLFVKSAIEALKKLKFVPAQINGKDADSAREVEYNFEIF